MTLDTAQWRSRANHALSPATITAGLWLIALIFVQFAPLSSDSWWQMWIARQMNAGIPLYEWINETNPPLWFWMARPVAYLSAFTGLPQPNLMVTGIMLQIALSLSLCWIFLRHLSPSRQTLILAGLLFCMIGPHYIEFGQRDHMALIALPPYVLLIAWRAEGKAVSLALALAIGSFAALMIALKPHIALVPIALELWLIYKRRSFKPFRPECLCLAIGAVVYIASIAIFAPAYFTDIIPAVTAAYGDFGGHKIRVFLSRAALMLPIVALYFWSFRGSIPPTAQAFLAMGVGFTGSMLVQFKGFLYHGDPVASAMLMAVLFNIVLREGPITLRKRTLLVAMVGFALSPFVQNERPYQQYAAPLVSDLAPGTKVATVLIDPTQTWPLLERNGLINVSRYYHHWMLVKLNSTLRSGEDLPPKLQAIADDIRSDLANDLLCNPPDVLLVTPGALGGQWPVVDFLKQDPRLAPVISAYSEGPALEHLARYDRVAPLPAPTPDLECYTLAR
ncbi:hypothetical protein JHL21_14210 [Devosia sp. WQ 349]|uniref:hypothetical protein n=1 Tax=Devosia sp. WQ 349K1 TaxID=2800329 RepID=UPI001903C5CC|nr:hypothetical protein [Devosia sp. WQ 349K1]MBK1795653.1 hypothetical protein [Devosia sp. WQ 349K1]